MRALAQLLRMAAGDIRRDGVLSVCTAFTLAATLAPLLTLVGLELGAIGAMIERLDRDPSMRSILPEVTGANRFDRAWFTRVAAWPDVAFVMPNTRAIAGQVDLFAASAPAAVRASWLPTAAGDPVTANGAPPDLGLERAILSSQRPRNCA